MHPKATECKVCGAKALYKGALCQLHWREYATEKMRKARAEAKARPKKLCKTKGCLNRVHSPYARYCAAHAPAAKRAVREHANQMLTPVVGRAEKLRREKEPQAEAVVVAPTVRVTRLPAVAPTFRDYIGEAQERPYQRRSRSGAAW